MHCESGSGSNPSLVAPIEIQCIQVPHQVTLGVPKLRTQASPAHMCTDVGTITVLIPLF